MGKIEGIPRWLRRGDVTGGLSIYELGYLRMLRQIYGRYGISRADRRSLYTIY